jgi:hypothetical protein
LPTYQLLVYQRVDAQIGSGPWTVSVAVDEVSVIGIWMEVATGIWGAGMEEGTKRLG